MFEYHGWLVLSLFSPLDTSNEVTIEERDKNYAKLNRRFMKVVHKYHLDDSTHQCVTGQWLYMFALHGFHNHCNGGVYKIFDWCTKNAPGSYGLLYVQDGESEFPFEFRAWVLQNGQFVERGDPFLSPVLPLMRLPEDRSYPDRVPGCFHQ